MTEYIFNCLKYVLRKKIIYLILIIYFLSLIIVFWQLGLQNKIAYQNNYHNIRDESGNISAGFYDLKNLLFKNLNSIYLKILNLFVIVYLGFLIFALFGSLANNIDLIIFTKSFSRHKMFFSKVVAILVAYLPLFLVIIIPALIGLSIDLSSTISNWWMIWVNDILEKLFILLFLPLFLVFILIIRSKTSFIIIISLFWPLLLVLSSAFQSGKMGDLKKRDEYYFVQKDGSFDKFNSYDFENGTNSGTLDAENFSKYQKDSYKYTSWIDLYGHIGYIGSLLEPEIIENSRNQYIRSINEWYDLSLIEQENYLPNTNQKYVGVKNQDAENLAQQKIDDNLANFILENIINGYQTKFDIDLNNDQSKKEFDVLISNTQNGEEPELLSTKDFFSDWEKDSNGNDYLWYDNDQKYLGEINLIINYLKHQNLLPEYFMTAFDAVANEGNYYFTPISYKPYIQWYIMLIYPFFALIFTLLSWQLFLKKDYY